MRYYDYFARLASMNNRDTEPIFAQDIHAARTTILRKFLQVAKDFLKRKHSTDITSWMVPRLSDTDAGLFRAISSSGSTSKRRVSKEKLPGARRNFAGNLWRRRRCISSGMQVRTYASINHPVPKATDRNFPMNVASTNFSSAHRGTLFQPPFQSHISLHRSG